MVAQRVKLVIIGKAKYWSGIVRSVNQNIPPFRKLSTGTFAIWRKPMKNDMNTGI